MPWLLLAFGTACFETLRDVQIKGRLHHLPGRVAAWGWMTFGLPFCLFALWLDGIPTIQPAFWLALLGSGGLNIFAMSFYTMAVQKGNLSQTIPLLAFSPMFLLITAPVIAGETPSLVGMVGVLLIVVGSYLLNLNQRKNGWLAPFRALLVDRSAQLMLAVAFLWSIAAAFDKVGVVNSSPLMWAVSVFGVVSLGLTIPMLRTPHSLTLVRTNWLPLLWLGLFASLSVITQMLAVAQANVAYVIAIKRLSILLAVVVGYVIFHEHGIRDRLVGASVMLAGVLIIGLL